jgi:hypothetical protein
VSTNEARAKEGVQVSRHPSAEDLAAYSIGGLDARTEKSVDRHLSRCESCAAELRERYAPAVAVLAESVEQHEPPPELRQSVMAAVRHDAESGGEGAEADPRERRSKLAGFLLRPVAALGVIALVVAAGAGYQLAGGGDEPAEETIALPPAGSGMAGDLVLEDGSATLHMRDVAPLDEPGSVYQVWVADPSGIEPSAAFLPHEDGTATAAVPEAADDATNVMITREPMAGRRQPSGPVLIDLSL